MIVSIMTEQMILVVSKKRKLSSFVLQRYEVRVGDPVKKARELMYCNRGNGVKDPLKY
jgi:hypothetical protein